jgi:hypothetical protein
MTFPLRIRRQRFGCSAQALRAMQELLDPHADQPDPLALRVLPRVDERRQELTASAVSAVWVVSGTLSPWATIVMIRFETSWWRAWFPGKNTERASTHSFGAVSPQSAP